MAMSAMAKSVSFKKQKNKKQKHQHMELLSNIYCLLSACGICISNLAMNCLASFIKQNKQKSKNKKVNLSYGDVFQTFFISTHIFSMCIVPLLVHNSSD